MSDWVLIPCLKALFAEFNRIAPSRDHASDGSIGDTAHQNEVSDHNADETGNVPIHDADHINEVHAIDVDNNLNRPDLGSDPMEAVIQFFVAEVRKNNPNGTDRGRLRYFIYNKRIWKASNGWKQEAYTGPSPHTEHAHFSAEYETSYESDTSSWGLVEKFGDTVSKQDVIEAFKDPAGQAAFRTMLATAYNEETGITIYNQATDDDPNDTKKLGDYTTGAPGTGTDRIENAVAALTAKVDEMNAKLDAHIAGLVEGGGAVHAS